LSFGERAHNRPQEPVLIWRHAESFRRDCTGAAGAILPDDVQRSATVNLIRDAEADGLVPGLDFAA
jgi:hypothetical protein